jgi:hypothetical protein
VNARLQCLLFILVLIGTFAGGFYFDRSLHRPLVMQLHVDCKAPSAAI